MENTSKGISPVIGVVLLVAVTVLLVGLSTIIMFDYSGDKISASTATLDTNENNDIKLIRNENFEKIQIQYEDGSTVTELTNIGESYNLNIEGDYNIIGILPDGDKQLIDTITIDSGFTEISFVSQEIEISEIQTSETNITTDITIGEINENMNSESIEVSSDVIIKDLTQE